MRPIAALVLLASSFATGCFSGPPKASGDGSPPPATCLEAWDAIADDCAEEWDAYDAQCTDDPESADCENRRDAFNACTSDAGGDWECEQDETTTCPVWAAIVCDFSSSPMECPLAESSCV